MREKSTVAPYVAPELELHQVAVEAGFADSPEFQSTPDEMNWDDVLT